MEGGFGQGHKGDSPIRKVTFFTVC